MRMVPSVRDFSESLGQISEFLYTVLCLYQEVNKTLSVAGRKCRVQLLLGDGALLFVILVFPIN